MDFKYSLDFLYKEKANIEMDLDELSLDINSIDNGGRGWCHEDTQAAAREKIIPIENKMDVLQKELNEINKQIKEIRGY
jgi:hypothetical protein